MHTDPPEPEKAVESNALPYFAFSQAAEHNVTLNFVAPENILPKLVTFFTFHAERSRLNAVAVSNIFAIFVTAPTSHELIGWLNAVATKNILTIFVTALTFHESIGWLNGVE
jgi:hypothetical protein